MSIWDKLDELLEKGRDDKNICESGNKDIYENKQNVIPSITKSSQALYITIGRHQTYLDLSSLSDEEGAKIIRKIKNMFTISSATILGYDKKTTCFAHQGNKLIIPRFGASVLKDKFSKVLCKNNIKLDNPIELKYTGESSTNVQQLILDNILSKNFSSKKLEQGQSGVIVNLQAGFGKTYLAMNLMAILGCRTLVVTHNSTILKQWKDLLIEKFPNNKIACYYGKKKEYGDIIIGVINSLILDHIQGFKSPKEFFKTFDLLILDECHEYCSPARSKLFDICQCPYMLGLSATPEERTDNLSKVIKWNIGPILQADKLKGYTTIDAPFKGHVIQVRYVGPTSHTRPITNEKLATISAPKMIEQFTKDEQRTNIIVELIMEFHNKGHNIFVFADRRDYLEKINDKLKARSASTNILTNDDELKSIRLVGGSKEEDLTDARKTKRIILTTYQYMGTGCSIPKMNCIILATPRRHKSRQIINRIFRLGSDYSIVRQIVDIIDWRTALKNQFYERNKYYVSQKFTHEIRKITAEDL